MVSLLYTETTYSELRLGKSVPTQAASIVRLPGTCHFCACRARRETSQCLAKSSPYAGPSAGAEVARLRKWHVWCLREHGLQFSAEICGSEQEKSVFHKNLREACWLVLFLRTSLEASGKLCDNAIQMEPNMHRRARAPTSR